MCVCVRARARVCVCAKKAAMASVGHGEASLTRSKTKNKKQEENTAMESSAKLADIAYQVQEKVQEENHWGISPTRCKNMFCMFLPKQKSRTGGKETYIWRKRVHGAVLWGHGEAG